MESTKTLVHVFVSVRRPGLLQHMVCCCTASITSCYRNYRSSRTQLCVWCRQPGSSTTSAQCYARSPLASFPPTYQALVSDDCVQLQMLEWTGASAPCRRLRDGQRTAPEWDLLIPGSLSFGEQLGARDFAVSCAVDLNSPPSDLRASSLTVASQRLLST